MALFIKSVKKIVAFIQGKPYSIETEDERYSKFETLLTSDAPEDKILELVDTKTAITKAVTPLGFYIDDENFLYYDGKKVPSDLAFIVKGFKEIYSDVSDDEIEDLQPLKNFIVKLFKNPNYENIEDIYSFLQKGKLPITDNGNFLAYKVVRSDFKDCHTGTIDNSPGSEPSMDRSACDLSRHNTCSSGLHFCSKSYIGSFGTSSSKIVEVEVSPEDVTSIPSDYNDAKGRCCKYKVIREIKEGDLCGHKVVYRTPEPEVVVEVAKDVVNDYTPSEESKQVIKDGGFVTEVPKAVESKVCSKCKVVKPLVMFPKDKSTKSGYYSQCKECKNSSKRK